MTLDHIDDFSDALDNEKRGYLICVHNGLEYPNSGAHVRTDFDNWPDTGCGSSQSKSHDVLLAIAAALSVNGEHFEVIRRES